MTQVLSSVTTRTVFTTDITPTFKLRHSCPDSHYAPLVLTLMFSRKFFYPGVFYPFSVLLKTDQKNIKKILPSIGLVQGHHYLFLIVLLYNFRTPLYLLTLFSGHLVLPFLRSFLCLPDKNFTMVETNECTFLVLSSFHTSIPYMDIRSTVCQLCRGRLLKITLHRSSIPFSYSPN